MLLKVVPFYLILLVLCTCKNDTTSTSLERCRPFDNKNNKSLRMYLEPYEHLFLDQSGGFVLEDGDGSMIARAWLTEHAESTIDIQYFIFSLDNVGLIACDYLVRAADRGVKVRILVDDILVEADAEDILSLESHPNIEIKIYNPNINLGKNIFQKAYNIVTDFRGINQRMHNKCLIVDEKAVITGGRNIADEYFDYDHEYNFRDRDIFLMGKVCQKVSSSFENFWNDGLSQSVTALFPKEKLPVYQINQFDKLHQYACDTANYWPQVRQKIASIPLAFNNMVDSGALILTDSIDYISDMPGKNQGSEGLKGSGLTTQTLVKLIQGAQKTIDIQTPYLVTTEIARDLFTAATRRGVRIRILTNSLASTDNVEAFSGYQRDRAKLLKTGVEIYEWRPDAACRFNIMTSALQKKMDYTPIFGLHAKTMVVDGHITVIGTFNLDPRSAHLNTECITIVHHPSMAKSVLDKMNEEFEPQNAWRTTADWNPDQQVGKIKRWKTKIRRVVPKSIL